MGYNRSPTGRGRSPAGDDAQANAAIPILFDALMILMHGARMMFVGYERQGAQDDPKGPAMLQEWVVELWPTSLRCFRERRTGKRTRPGRKLGRAPQTRCLPHITVCGDPHITAL
jgi:hypothetical protein